MAEEEKSASPEGIRHVRAPAAAPILDVLVSVGLEREAAVTLLDLGAIYVERVRVPPGTHGMQVAENAYIRIHTHPRRFPLANTIDWRARIQHECPDFILVDKPGGVPVHPSLDNSVETCVECVSKVSGDQLTALHRLDVPTHGLLVLGRTPSFTSHFNKLLRERTMSKEYRALVWARPAEGLLVHYMEPSKRSPKVLSQECVEGWQDCKLIIKNVRGMPPSQLSKEVLSVMLEQFRRRRDQSTFPSPVSSWASRYEQGPPSAHSSSSASGEKDWCSAAIAYEVEVELLTGRTHQIRAQLSHVGCPLVGDEMYTTHVDQRKITADAAQRKVTEDASHRSAEQTNTAAHGATEEEGGAGEEREKEERERRWREQQDLAREMEVQGTLGLQACKISFAQLSPAAAHACSQRTKRRKRGASSLEPPALAPPHPTPQHPQPRPEANGDAEEGGGGGSGGSGEGREGERGAGSAGAEGGGGASVDFTFELSTPWWRLPPPPPPSSAQQHE